MIMLMFVRVWEQLEFLANDTVNVDDDEIRFLCEILLKI